MRNGSKQTIEQRLLGLLLLVGLAVALATAAAPGPEAGERGRPVVVHAGQLLDVRTGELHRDVTILIRDGRIVAVGRRVRQPADAEVIDLSDATVLPGLIDVHTHLTYPHDKFGYEGLGLSVARRALYGAVNAERVLLAGFTTAREVGAGGFADVALREAINEGDLPGPRLLVAGPSLGITGGHCDNNLLPAEWNHRAEGVADGPWAVRTQVRENIKYGADVIKFCATGGVLSRGDDPNATQYTLEEMQALVEEAHKLGRRVAAHAHGTEGISLAIRAGVDSIEHCTLVDEEGLALLRRHNTYMVPTVYALDFILEEGGTTGIPDYSLQKARELKDARDRAFRVAFSTPGINIAFGTDTAVFPHGLGGREFGRLVDLGLDPLRAIQAATTVAAALLGLEDEIGTLEPGQRADLIAVRGNPLEDIRVLENVLFVMKDGEVYKNEF
ncbi:MAG: amidohydrolase family protein [Candidatus Acidoferrales bacterium]